ncbi:NlpC/P60 family protein [[Clostridium] aminophilum]|uniref:NlpC/P60 family protein n=1 Tax=[Clostridium] aminophilum TaxID=1526 RepID=UPI003F9E509F
MKKFLKLVVATGAILTLMPAGLNAAAAQKVQPLPETVQTETNTLQTEAPAVSAGNVAVPQVRNNVNVRAEANTASSVVGKMNSDMKADILETVEGEDGEWYKIQTGDIIGYVKASLCKTESKTEANTDSALSEKPADNAQSSKPAAAAEQTSKPVDTAQAEQTTRPGAAADTEKKEETAKAEKPAAVSETSDTASVNDGKKKVAKVDVAVLNVRKSASIDSEKLTSVERGETYEVLGKENEFTKVRISDSVTGYVATEYITLADAEKAAPANNTAEDTSSGTAPAALNPEKDSSANKNDSAGKSTFANGSANGPGSAGGSFGTGSDTTAGSSNDAEKPTDSGKATGTRAELVAYAKQFEGNPYVYGGTSLTNGADCSGFTMSIYKHFGISIGRSSRDQAANGKTISISDLQPGDLIFYGSKGYINHVALYIGGGEIIHASTASTGIKISNYNYKTPVKAVTFLN